MQNPYSEGDYVDCKHQGQGWWCVARVVAKDGDQLRIKFDGMASKNDITLRWNNPRIAPFRRYTVGYTGNPKSIRDDKELDITNAEDISTLIDVFSQKNYQQFEATKINQNLRGKVFLFTDALLSQIYANDFPEPEYINAGLEYLQKFLTFAITYLRNFPKHFINFTEGSLNAQLLTKKSEVAYSFYIYELVSSLTGIFGGNERCSRFYKQICQEIEPDELDFKPKEPVFTKDTLNPHMEEEMTSSTGIGELYNRHTAVDKIKINFANSMIEKFAAAGGFKVLLNLIFSENEEENGLLSDRSTTTKGNYFISAEEGHVAAASGRVKYGCPMQVAEMILGLVKAISGRFKDQYGAQFLGDFKQRLYKRIKSISDVEIKELEIEQVQSLFRAMEEFLLQVGHKEVVEEFYEFKEIQCLNLYLRLMDSPSFEKKLKGINGIREYVAKLESAQDESDDPKAQKETLKHVDADKFTEWVLENKIIELIYEKYMHIELIKRSIEIQKFIAENTPDFPQHLIDFMWNSIKDKHEEVKKVIYENLIELAPCLDLQAAQKIFNKFLEVKYENYDEDFIDLIGRFTHKGLRLIVLKTKDDNSIRVNEAITRQENPQFFGVSLMFNLIMDDSPLSTSLSIRVLEYLQEIISEYPAVEIFLPIVEECLKNLERDVSIYQSLLIMKEYLTKMQTLPCYQETCENYFQKFQQNHNIIDYLTKNIESYFQKVRQRVQAIKSSRKPSLNGTHPQGNLQKECFIGKFSHEQNIFQRIDSLRYFIAHPYLDISLSIDQFKQLWNVFVKQPNFHFETTLFLQFISQFYSAPNKGLRFVVAIRDIKEVLLQILHNKEYLEIRDLTPEKLNCIEFYFVIANIHSNKLRLDQSEGFNLKNLTLKSNNVYKLDLNPIGLSYFWECLVECPDKELAERVTNFLVDLSTRVDSSLNLDQEAICSQAVHDIMTALKGALEQKHFRAIERYIMFLDKFLARFENKTGQIFYKINNTYSNMATSSPKVGLHVKLLPYNLPTRVDLNLKDRIGFIREVIANHYKLDNTDFQMTVCGTQIRNDDLLKDLASFYSVQNPWIQIVKKPASELHLDFKSFAVKEREYVEIFFEIFSTMINSEHLKNIWDFVHKLPLQRDIKKDFSELDSYIDILNGENQLYDQNIFRAYYYLSLIQSLSLTDEYYWKWKSIDVHSYKGEWAYHFENNQGIEWLTGLVLNTDFSQISNFLYIKTLLLLSKLLWLFLDFSENNDDDPLNHGNQQDFINSQFLTKCLDIFRYSSIYISSIPKSNLTAHVDVIKDHSLMCQYLSEVIQKLLKANHNHYQALLRYPELENLLTQVFLKLPHEETPHYEGQESFAKALSLLFQILRKSSQKQNSLTLLSLLFEDIFFKALDSSGPSYIILKFLSSILNEYDLKTDFGCDIDVLSIMIQVANLIKSHQQGKGFVYETKLGLCFFMLQKFLERNPDQISFFGQEQGLVQEILTQGVFRVPNINGEDGPKYQNKSNLVQAFELLAVFAKDQTNFKTISDFLLSIHCEGIWRGNKPSSWFISANIKRRSHKYAGLKNLGCTCYMNSTLQQLFMIPSFKKHIPMLQDPKFDPSRAHDNLLFQLKRLFYGMNHIDKEYFSPKMFCLAFKDIDGSPTSFIEQKDAFEFLSLFMDRIEEQLKGTKYANIIKAHFGGLYSNELICKGCPHYYEREEPFLALNLTVKNKRSIKDGLERLIEGEILDGDNAYYCEQCKAKVKTIKRTSIKKLPPYLFLNLQRFEYNFDLNIRVKVNDFCEFPMELDMTPYTQQHLSKIEKQPKNDTNSKTLEENDHAKYTLKGVVIHMGTADSGHYYSIIRDRRSDDSGDTWIEFNDEKVSEFNMNNLPNIAFGDREGCPTIQSAYVLVYEKKEQSEDLQKLEQEIHAQDSRDTTNRIEEFAMEKVAREVQKKNKRIFYISNIFSAQYPAFIRSLIENYEQACSFAEGVVPVPAATDEMQNQSQSQSMEDEDDPQVARDSFRNLFSFVWVVYCTSILRMDDRELSIQKTFFEWLYSRVVKDTQNCISVLEYFVHHDFFTEMLLQNPHQRSRRFLVSLITKAFRKVYKTEKAENYLFEVDDRGSPISACANFLSSAINLLDTTKLYLQTLGEYFYMFIAIIKIDSDLLQYLLSKDFLGRLLTYFFMHRDGEGKDQYPELNFFEYNLPIDFDSEIISPYREWKEDDFTNSNITNLAYFFQLVWKLLRYTSAPIGQGQTKRMHYNSKVNYMLSSKETRLLNLTQDQIIEMIDSIDATNKRVLKDVCRIIAYASYNSLNNSNACCKHIQSELESDTENERIPELLVLIRELSHLKDSLQQRRNRTLLKYLVQTMAKRPDDYSSLNLFSEFLLRLIHKNPAIRPPMENLGLYDEAINALQSYCLKSNHIHAVHASRPINFQALEKKKDILREHIGYFEEFRDGTDREEDQCSDTSSQPSVPNYKRQQPVQYYDSLKKKWRKGVVEDTYEDVVKVKKMKPPGSESPEYEWFDNDDTSYLRPEGRPEIEQENDGPAIDLSTKEFGQDEDYTTDGLSVRPNSAASSPDLD